ncbi:hypothetical protein E2C01_053063 [Portunus trituberculatus]|uniref:Uncharacterized protein n=1 Tax=Portunus trituberculatus TaxID=210409 RepID=A0A5B7GPT5_PORTR|nr:hypothetical protein [Portunus trituberculatus]
MRHRLRIRLHSRKSDFSQHVVLFGKSVKHILSLYLLFSSSSTAAASMTLLSIVFRHLFMCNTPALLNSSSHSSLRLSALDCRSVSQIVHLYSLATKSHNNRMKASCGQCKPASKGRWTAAAPAFGIQIPGARGGADRQCCSRPPRPHGEMTKGTAAGKSLTPGCHLLVTCAPELPNMELFC